MVNLIMDDDVSTFEDDDIEPSCIICGCTESHACEGGCSWLAIDRDATAGICSACVGPSHFGAVGPQKRQLERERIATHLLTRFLVATGARR